jgi:hypothetical protein
MPPAMILVFPVGVSEPPNVDWAFIVRVMAREMRVRKMVRWSVFMVRPDGWSG